MENVILNVYRGDVVENSHRGHIAVVDDKGHLLYSFGNPYRITHGRSALKPFQALPVIETGTADHFQFTAADLALCASSHSGEEIHRRSVQRILDKIDVGVNQLVCGITPPIDKQSYEDMIRRNEPINTVCQECSGVHAGMLATAIYMEENTEGYAKPTHPVQRRVKRAVLDMTSTTEQEVQLATDGCGIPTFCMPLYNIAWGFARLANPSQVQPEHRSSVERMVTAYLKHPEMITGTNTYSTRVFRAFGNRIILKEGSQGVFGMTDLDAGVGVAIKIEDGRKTELPPVLNELFRQLGIGTHGPLQSLEQDMNWQQSQLEDTNHQVVGKFKASFTLQAHA
ncbi:asparaginase [Alicyclobacillus curvatus]|nr:asparaginase [Alicyclobacillus curvatus]